MADSTFNLTALSERLFAEGRLKPLAGKIARAQELASLAADLTMALENLDALDALLAQPKSSNDFARTVTEAALLNNAVVLYARATKTTSDERKGFDPCSRFSTEEALVHQELVDLRDKAIAHFGSGGSYKGEWQSEVVVLQVTGGDARAGVATRRQTTDKKLLERARKQIEAAHTLFRKISLEKVDDVTDELQKLTAADTEFFAREIRRHPLNFGMFLKSDDAAEIAKSAIGQPYIKGIVRHGS